MINSYLNKGYHKAIEKIQINNQYFGKFLPKD